MSAENRKRAEDEEVPAGPSAEQRGRGVPAMNKTVVTWLKRLHACKEAVEWVEAQQTPAQAWRDCEDGSWMLWLLGLLSGKPRGAGRKKLVLACCECARLSLKYVPEDERRPLKAIQTAERWARGEATIEEVRSAAYAATDAAHAYAAAAAADAADAAAYATYADAAYAAYAAAAAAADAYAADAHAAAHAAYAAAAAARKETLIKCAHIVRKHYPKPPRLRA